MSNVNSRDAKYAALWLRAFFNMSQTDAALRLSMSERTWARIEDEVLTDRSSDVIRALQLYLTGVDPFCTARIMSPSSKPPTKLVLISFNEKHPLPAFLSGQTTEWVNAILWLQKFTAVHEVWCHYHTFIVQAADSSAAAQYALSHESGNYPSSNIFEYVRDVKPYGIRYKRDRGMRELFYPETMCTQESC